MLFAVILCALLGLGSSLPHSSNIQPNKPLLASTYGTNKPIPASTVGTSRPILASTYRTDRPVQASTVGTSRPILASTYRTDRPVPASTVGTSRPILASTYRTDKPVPVSTVGTSKPIAVSTVAPVSTGPSCGVCTPEKVWTDVVFVIDTSEVTGRRSAEMMWESVLLLGESFNMQPSNYTNTQQYMRVGVVDYSDDVEVVGALGTMSFLQMRNIYLPFLGGGENGTNLEKAIKTASDMFNTDGHRPSARKIIYILTHKYNTYTNAQGAAKSFKESGGIIMSYQYDLDNATPSQDLVDLASPNYYFHELLNSYDDVVQGFCDANCFCPNNQVSLGATARGTPTEGCYSPVDSPRSLALGNTNCRNRFNGGYIASAQTRDKQNFLTKLMKNSIYIIGLQNNNGNLQWSDGSALGSYHPFRSGAPSTSDMVIVTNGLWDLSNSLNRYWYVCESSPCSSNKYCDTQ